MIDWKRELVIGHLIKQEIEKVDINQIWQNTLPEVRASEDEVLQLEAKLGYPLNPAFRDFLLHANGWRAFSVGVDILGVPDLLAGPRAARAIELTESLEPLRSLCGFEKSDLMPVAVSVDDIDLVLMTRPHTSEPGKVFWFAGGLIETFPSFEEWFLAMLDYLRAAYQRLANQPVH